MLKSWTILLLILFPSLLLNAQKQGNIWYFGLSAGINFNTSPPSALTNSTLTSYEASASIADASGDLLFYSNGVVIHNKQHQIMENGNGLLGHPSSTQGAIIVPWPERDSLYYLITADASENSGANGYAYSLVNSNRNNGLGSVIEKNRLLYAPSTEKLAVAQHRNKRDWWLITKVWGNNEYRVYLIDQNGLNTTPVITSIGSVLNGDPSKMSGCMKLSPDNKKLAVTFFDNTIIESYLEVFDFNNANGQLSNTIRIKENSPYGLEFSSNSKFLYISNKDLNNPFERKIDQLDVSSATDAITLEATRTVISPPDYDKFPMGLQMGPDGKIYIAALFNLKVDVITLPNNKGLSCSLQSGVIDLQGRVGRIMFPTIIYSLLAPPSFDIDATFIITNPCKREVQLYATTNQTTNATYQWNLGNHSNSSLKDPKTAYPNTKDVFEITLDVVADVQTNTGIERQKKTITKQVKFNPFPQAYSGKDTFAVAGKPLQLNGYGGVAFQWTPTQFLNNATVANPIATLFADQMFTLTVSNADGCISKDQMHVRVFKQSSLYVPTAFTPNNDSKNNLLHVFPVGMQLQQFQVYNRWGNMVFSTNDHQTGWNGMYKGKPQPEGMYVWMAKARDDKGKIIVLDGTVYLMR